MTQSSSDIVMREIELWGEGRERVLNVSTRGALLYKTAPYSEAQNVHEHCRIHDMFSALWHEINDLPPNQADGPQIHLFIQIIC